MISSKIGHSLDPLLINIYRFFFKRKEIDPVVFTVSGLISGIIASILILSGYLVAGGLMLIVSSCFDLLDGAIARNTGKVTSFGGFLDSVLDRYTDLIVMYGLFFYFLKRGEANLSAITFIAAIGVAIIPYAKARAEAASLTCNTGIMERPERMIILIVGLIFGLPKYAVIILALLTHITVIQRIVYVLRAARKDGPLH